jgi:NAD(P)-dependent dehydrogenase (short-subunit alcohol dehydrogenase family)
MARQHPLDTEMTGRTALVTGATDGHGRAMAKLLAARGAEVVVHARSREKAERVCDEIAAETGRKRPEILLADLAVPQAIDAAVASYRSSGRPLHLLVNNAGLVTLSRQTNEQGHELTFAVNYLAMVRLTFGLLPVLRTTAPARIVNVSSDTYRIGSLDFDDLMFERGFSMARAYARSKLAILYFTLELARRIEGSGVTVNAVDPGPVASNIGANNPGLAYRLVGPLLRTFFPSAERAARTALWIATDPALADQTGGYYRSLARREKPLDFDPETSWRLWETGLSLNAIEDPTSGSDATGEARPEAPTEV